MSYTREQAKEVLKDFYNENDCCFNDGKVKSFIKNKFQQLPETGLVVDVDESLILMRFGKESCYGFNYLGEWIPIQTDWEFDSEDWRPATKEDEKRWEELLIKEAKRRGFKEGVKYKVDWFGVEETDTLSNGEWLYNNNEYGYTTLCKVGCPWVFKNGKWAEKLEEPKDITTEEAEEALNKFVEWFGNNAKNL